jgi:hypothetical protein
MILHRRVAECAETDAEAFIHLGVRLILLGGSAVKGSRYS